jgi:hypothetical protein
VLIRTFLLLAFVTAAAAPPQSSGPAELRALRAAADKGLISVNFRLDGAFASPEVTKALHSGLPTGFTYHVDLVRKRPNWFDSKVEHARIDVICTYNSVTREYLLNYRRNKRLVRSEIFSDPAALMQRMTTIDEPELFEAAGHRPYKLAVRVKADVMRGYLLQMIPVDISTGWTTARVRTVPER